MSAAVRLLPATYIHRRAVSELKARTSGYPELSVGDLIARCFHDWDNEHGLEIDGGGLVHESSPVSVLRRDHLGTARSRLGAGAGRPA